MVFETQVEPKSEGSGFQAVLHVVILL